MQVSGAIAQTMATYMTGHKILTGLFGRRVSSDQIAQCVVAATYKTIAGTRNAIATLTDKSSIVSIYKSAYLHCAPPSRRRSLLQAKPQAVDGFAQDVFTGIAEAYKASNHTRSKESREEDANELWEQLASALDASSKASTAAAAPEQQQEQQKGNASDASLFSIAAAPGAAATSAAAAGSKPASKPADKPGSRQPAVDAEVADLFAAAARVSAALRAGFWDQGRHGALGNKSGAGWRPVTWLDDSSC